MAILKQFLAKSHDVIIDNHEVIYISDDDSDDSNDECEFEDVGVDVSASMVEYTEAKFEEVADDTAHDEEAEHEETGIDAPSLTDDFPPEHRSAGVVDREVIATGTTPHEDAEAGGDWGLHDDSDEVSGPEPIDLDQNGIDALCAPDVAVHASVSSKDIAAELAALRNRVTLLEAQVHLDSVTCQATSPSKKRKQSTSASPRAKRLHGNRTLNISATRAYVYWNDTSERCLYTWRRGQDGHCWVGRNEAGKEQKVDGEVLLCCASTIAIEIRANADWLPIEVRFNESRQVFEGQASVGRRKLEVAASVMMDLMCGQGRPCCLSFLLVPIGVLE